jgi:hypothetical protein
VSDDLWYGASADHEQMARQAAMARAEAEFAAVFPFLAAAASEPEFLHRMFLAGDRLQAIAASSGTDVEDLEALAGRRWRLMREALAEGESPLSEVMNATHERGSGALKDYQHSEAPDFSEGYSEVPAGAEQGPDPQVTQVRPPQTGPVQEATGSLHREADAAMMTAPYTAPQPPDTGTGRGSLDTGLPQAGGNTPSLPAGVSGGNSPDNPITPRSIGQVTSSTDPVCRRVLAVTAAVAASNPQLPESECERVARLVVGRYLTADLAGSVTSDAPVNDGSGDGGGDGGSKGPGMAGRFLEYRGLQSVLPNLGGGAGEAAGAGEGLMGAAELAAL